MTRPEPLRAVLFDMDGVLVRTEEAWFRTVEASGVAFRGRPVTREEFAPTFGQGTLADIRVFGLRCTPAELDAFYRENFIRFAGHVEVDDDARAVLEAIRSRGLRSAVVTNTMERLAKEVLRAARLDAHVDFLSCADQVPRPKPAPDLVVRAMQALAVGASEALVVGDSRYDREAAQAAGVRFVGLRIDGDARVERLADVLAHA